MQSFLLQNCHDLVLQPDVSIPANTQWAFALRKEDEALAANLSRAISYLSAYSVDLQDITTRHFRIGETCSVSQLPEESSRVSFSSMGGVFLSTGIIFFCAIATAATSSRRRGRGVKSIEVATSRPKTTRTVEASTVVLASSSSEAAGLDSGSVGL